MSYSRSRMTKAKRVRVFDAAKGICHLCGLPIRIGEQWEVEHVKPLWCSGADDESNMAPAHLDCHATKTKAEAAPRAKTNAQRAKHILPAPPTGANRLRSRGFQKFAKPEKPPLGLPSRRPIYTAAGNTSARERQHDESTERDRNRD